MPLRMFSIHLFKYSTTFFTTSSPFSVISANLTCLLSCIENRASFVPRRAWIRYIKRAQWGPLRKRAKNALTLYSGKQRTLDRFFAGLKTNFGGNESIQKRPVVVAYGSATIHPTGKGEVSVPVKYVLKVCQRHYKTVMVNEHLTTKVHNVCHQRMHPVSRESEKYSIRGLCWCPTCAKFVSRDGNAAQNILRVYRTMHSGGLQGRPYDLRFGQPKQEMATLPLVQRGVPKQQKTWRALLSF